ncbi:hypothetical protein JHK82_016088 [Glycine max]|nr:hypothetical protein JHK85_016486 [Glycine max]KAG5046709.1 hypothetical protein JHK86_016115 [Glycine max]KAG5149207.1 hypothetical protein JHK82_016088 [Glycine max]
MNPELEHLLANVPKITPEEQPEWKELTKKIQDTVAPPDAIFVIVSARDQIFGEVGKVYTVKFKDVLEGVWHLVDRDDTYHTVVYNRDLDQPAIVAGVPCLPKSFPKWHSLYHQVPGSVTFKDIPSTIYYILKDKGWYNLHLGNVAECRLVFNHHRMPLKIGAGWKQFYQTLSLDAGAKIVFEFINPRVNCVLYWLCSVDEMR